MDMKFGTLLKEYREMRGVTKTSLASKLGVSLTYIINLENSKEKPPTIERIDEIAGALNLDNLKKSNLVKLAYEERLSNNDIAFKESIGKSGLSEPEAVYLKSKIRDIPIISWVAANRFAHVEDPFPRGFPMSTSKP